MSRLTSLLAAGTIALSLGVTAPARAQWIVFDPNNYVQNVLTAARALQQINNQITSLQNQAQMLINQAKNLQACRIHRCSNYNPRSSGPSNCWPRPSELPTTSSRSIARSRLATRLPRATSRTRC